MKTSTPNVKNKDLFPKEQAFYGQASPYWRQQSVVIWHVKNGIQ